jgi:hypothetical protein
VEEPAITPAGAWLSPGKATVVTLTPAGVAAAPDGALIEKGGRFSGQAIRFTLRRVDDKTLILRVDNGYGQTLRYAAQIYLADGRNTGSSTCPVMGGSSVFESWVDPIARIRVSNFELQPTTAGQQDMRCY